MRRKSNKYPFIILLIIHTSLLLFTFIKKKDKKTIFALLLSNMGFAYLFEYIVLNIFQSYKYKPKFLKTSYLDNILGAILSQAIYIPFTALFVTAFNLKWKTKALFVLYFQTIEQLFIKWKVYETKWWNPFFTSLLLPVYFFLSDKWYLYLKKRNLIVQITTLFLANLVTRINLLFILAVLREYRFGRGMIKTWKEHFIYAPLYGIILSLVSTACSRMKNGFLSSGIYISFSLVFDRLLVRLGLVQKNLKGPFSVWFLHIVMLFFTNLFKDLIYQEVQQKNE